MNRRIALALAVLAALALPAGARAFALQVSFPGGGWMWGLDPDFVKVYDEKPFSGSEAAFDVEFWEGLALSLHFRELSTFADTKESLIDFRFREQIVQFGPKYRFKYVGWVYPYLTAQLAYIDAWEKIGDGVMDFEMEDDLLGFYGEIGAEFYPFYWARGGAPGLGVYLGGYMQTLLYGGAKDDATKSDAFGVIDDLSGIGLRLGMTYRWDWDLFRRQGRIFGKRP
jgi:hypothetical protein